MRRNQEHFWVIGLNNNNKILFIESVSLGAVNRVTVSPPNVFRMVIYKLAVRMILVHNHPSGSVKPSKSDLDCTDRMLKTGKLIGIEVIDHLIISETIYTSFSDEELIKELATSGLYEIIDREKAELKKLTTEVARDKAKDESKLEIAKKLKAEGMDEKFIKKVTGLYLRQIRALA
ncbi:MAG: JAB domain-containing protein [Saprospiraceae bacterium]